MGAVVGEIAAFVGAVKVMVNLKRAWTRAHGDGVRLWEVRKWGRYYGGRDPHKGIRCGACLMPLTANELAGRRTVCDGCWGKLVAESQAPRGVGVRFEP
jgi:hypothetical protein